MSTPELLRTSSRFVHARRAVLLALFAAAAAAAWWLWDHNRLTSADMFQAVADHPVLAPVVFVALYAVAMFFLIPTLPLNIGAGIFWGGVLGGVYTVLGTTLGGCCAFLFARSALGQPLARGFKLRMVERLARAAEDCGWKVVAFARLNPLMPTGLCNFVFGLTALRLGTYTWGTLVFSYPLAYLVAHIGHSTGSFLLQGDAASMLRLGGGVLGLGLIVLAARYLMRGPKAQD